MEAPKTKTIHEWRWKQMNQSSLFWQYCRYWTGLTLMNRGWNCHHCSFDPKRTNRCLHDPPYQQEEHGCRGGWSQNRTRLLHLHHHHLQKSSIPTSDHFPRNYMSWNYQHSWELALATDSFLVPLNSHFHHHCLHHCPRHFPPQVPCIATQQHHRKYWNWIFPIPAWW